MTIRRSSLMNTYEYLSVWHHILGIRISINAAFSIVNIFEIISIKNTQVLNTCFQKQYTLVNPFGDKTS